MRKVRSNLRVRHRSAFNTVRRVVDNTSTVQDAANTSAGCSSSAPVNFIPDRCSARRNINVDDAGPSTSTTSRVSNIHDTLSMFYATSFEPSFRQRLASCFVDNNLTHVQGNNLLSLLRTHSCFSQLPQDVRILVSTPCNPAVTFVVAPGEYIHFDLGAEIINSLPNTLSV